MQEIRVWFLGGEDQLEKEMSTHSSILAWRITWMEEPGSGVAKSTTQLSDYRRCARNAGDPGLIPGWGRSPGEGNVNPPQYSCLENHMDGGAWQWGCKEYYTTEWLALSLTKERGFPGGPQSKGSAYSAGDLVSSPESGRSPGEGNANNSSILARRILWP